MESASSDSVDVDEIKDLLRCSLCSRTLIEPRILPCFHNFCKVCLGKYVERLRGGDKTIETFPCPTCRSEFTLKSNEDVADLTSSYFIKNMLEIKAIQEKAKASATCSRCKDPANNFCTTCEMLLCKKCLTGSHDFWPGNKNHNVLYVEEVGNHESQEKMRKKLLCNKHEGEVLEIFCQTCTDLCCIHCLSSNHLKHSCVAVNEVAQKQQEMLQLSCTTLDEKLSEGKKALNNICEVIKSLEKNAKTAKDQIKEQKEKILKIVAKKLDEKAKKMNKEVEEIYGKLHSELRKQHDEIKEYLHKVQASVSLPRNLLKIGSIEEILSSQKLIDENIGKLGNEKPEDLDALNDGGIQYVSDDISMINVDEIVGKLGYVKGGVSAKSKLKRSSNILKGEIAFIKQLHEWLGKKCEWNLCYRASRDGWSAEDFHRHCDNKGPTVFLVKANDCIFGGYTDQDWVPGCGAWKRSNSSFLFSLRNKDNLAPFIAKIKQGLQQNAICCYFGYGPRYGDDLYIRDNPQTNKSTSNLGDTYQLPPSYVYGSEQAKNLLAGQYKFLTTELEVFN